MGCNDGRCERVFTTRQRWPVGGMNRRLADDRMGLCRRETIVNVGQRPARAQTRFKRVQSFVGWSFCFPLKHPERGHARQEPGDFSLAVERQKVTIQQRPFSCPSSWLRLQANALQKKKSLQMRLFLEEEDLHAAVVWPAAALRRDPHNVLGRVLDVAGLAVHAVLRVDLQTVAVVGVLDELVDPGGAIA